jgi:hypothetical protein
MKLILFIIFTDKQGRIQDFKLGGGEAHLKKLRRAEGGANIFGVFRVKNHDFTPKIHIFSNKYKEIRSLRQFFARRSSSRHQKSV